MTAAEAAACAPRVGLVTTAAIVRYESGGRPTAIHDDTTHRSFAPATAGEAARLASALIAAGDDLDVGLMQINVANLAPYGLDVRRAFDPCTNLSVGSRILRAAYRLAKARYGPGRVALAHALSLYNSGTLRGGLAYARGVWSIGARLRARRPVSSP